MFLYIAAMVGNNVTAIPYGRQQCNRNSILSVTAGDATVHSHSVHLTFWSPLNHWLRRLLLVVEVVGMTGPIKGFRRATVAALQQCRMFVDTIAFPCLLKSVE